MNGCFQGVMERALSGVLCSARPGPEPGGGPLVLDAAGMGAPEMVWSMQALLVRRFYLP